MLYALFLVASVCFAIYLIPASMGLGCRGSVTVWSPVSFMGMIDLIVLSMGLQALWHSFLPYCFPGEDRVQTRKVPVIILVSILSGLANMALILLVTSSLKDRTLDLKYLTFYFGIVMLVYLCGRKFVQSSLISITREIIYDIRMKLMRKSFLRPIRNLKRWTGDACWLHAQ